MFDIKDDILLIFFLLSSLLTSLDMKRLDGLSVAGAGVCPHVLR